MAKWIFVFAVQIASVPRRHTTRKFLKVMQTGWQIVHSLNTRFLNQIFEMSFCSLHQVCFFFLSLNILIGWQLYICNCCKPFFPLLYNCQLLCSWRLAVSIAVQVFPRHFSPNIAPSRMFTTNSLCLTVCPIHEWRLFFKIFRNNISSFALWKTSSFVIPSVHFIF